MAGAARSHPSALGLRPLGVSVWVLGSSVSEHMQPVVYSSSPVRGYSFHQGYGSMVQGLLWA